MKTTALYICLSVALFSCKNKGTNTAATTGHDSTAVAGKDNATSGGPIEKAATEKEKSSAAFDINTIPLSDKALGKFPYLGPPDTYKYGMGYDKEIKSSDIRDFDKEYFAVDGKLIPLEGKTYKVSLEKDRRDGSRFNSLIVEKSYDDAIAALGGVKVNNVTIPLEEYQRIDKKELIDKRYGFSLSEGLLDRTKTYVIRTKDKEVWIQMFLLNDESGNLTILEKGDLKPLKVSTY